MKTHLATLLLLVTATLSFQAAGHGTHAYPETPDMKWVGRKIPVPEVFITTVVAEREKALRLAAVELRNFTRATGYEGCAQVCQAEDGRVALPIKTNFSQVGCMTIRANLTTMQPVIDCPAGFRQTGERMHSHPEARSVQANPADAVFAKVGRGRRLTLRPETFSTQDHKGGPGSYLVADGRLLYLGTTGISLLGQIDQMAVTGGLLTTVPTPIRPNSEACRELPKVNGISLLLACDVPTDWTAPSWG